MSIKKKGMANKANFRAKKITRDRHYIMIQESVR